MDRVLERAPGGFVSFTDDGTIVEVNLTLTELLGYATRVELEGWHLQKILPPGGRIFYHTHVLPLLKLHGRADEVYLALKTKDGVEIPVLMNAARRERDGVTLNDAVFVRMSQRHRYEDELLQARRSAEQANAAKAKFLSMMSHDLRTPLTTISGNVRLLAAGVHGSITDEQKETLDRVDGACRHVARMIEDILSFAQLESGSVEVRPESVNVREALQRAEGLVRLRMEQSAIAFTHEPSEPGLSALADPDRLQQILLNLLANAIKFTRAGGRVSVGCARNGDRVSIRVRDTGVGIPAGALEKIFEPFVQLEQQPENREQRGVGLGLAISRELARAMDGQLTAESVEGSGSVFTLTLPVA
jgi:PAS domain S-box-containing protein